MAAIIGSPTQQGQEHSQSPARDHRKHGNDEQYMTYSVIDGRALNDEECKREDNARADDEAGALARHRQCHGPQAGGAVVAPCRRRFPHQNNHGVNCVDERNGQQKEKHFRQPGQELTWNVGSRQCVGPYPLAPMRRIHNAIGIVAK